MTLISLMSFRHSKYRHPLDNTMIKFSRRFRVKPGMTSSLFPSFKTAIQSPQPKPLMQSRHAEFISASPGNKEPKRHPDGNQNSAIKGEDPSFVKMTEPQVLSFETAIKALNQSRRSRAVMLNLFQHPLELRNLRGIQIAIRTQRFTERIPPLSG